MILIQDRPISIDEATFEFGILRAHGVVESRRDRPRVFYTVIEPKVARISS